MTEKKNYDEYFYLDKDFRDIVSNPDTFRMALNKFLDNAIDTITLGVIFEIHRKNKTGALDGEPDPSGETHATSDIHDIFGYDNVGKIHVNCDCPKCDRMVAPSKFAGHLETCMGLGRRKNPTRGTTHSIINTNSNSNNSSSSNANTKDKEEDGSDYGDDDVEWSSRQKTRKRKRNKSKKGKGTPKKGSNILPDIDSVNVDVEGDDDADIMLRDIMQDNSNQSSPAESVASSNASKKREKSSKSKRSKRDRTSPNSNLDKK